MDQEQKLPPALLSVVTPCYNEAGGLREFVDRIAAAMTQIGQGFVRPAEPGKAAASVVRPVGATARV